MKRYLSPIITGVICFVLMPLYAFADEKITLSTYYPAPYGEYRTLAVGDTYPAPAAGGNTDLVVEGDVGIGTTNPTEKLDVQGYINAQSLSGEASYKIGTWGIVGSTAVRQALFGGMTASQWDSIGLFTSGTEKVRIDTNGNVGIGTTAPSEKLDITDSGDVGAIIQTLDNQGKFAWLRIRGGDATNQSYHIAQLRFENNVADITNGFEGARISMHNSDTIANTACSDLAFYTNSSTAGSAQGTVTEKMRICYNGNVGIGTTAPTEAKLQLKNETKQLLSGTYKTQGIYCDVNYTELSAVSGDLTKRGLLVNVGGNDTTIGSVNAKYGIDVTVGIPREVGDVYGATGELLGISSTVAGSAGNTSDKYAIHASALGGDNGGNRYGIHAEASGATGTNYGVYAFAYDGATNYAGYFGNSGFTGSGNVHIQNGNLTINGGTKNFEIDHPIKSGCKLVHSTLEGPEAAVFYRGVARLKNGKTAVMLPDYFEALTRKEGRTISLTAKGAEPYLLSATDIVNGEFNVYGTKQDGDFYWEVKAVRADVEPLQVEKIKSQN